ncbi:membrane protein [Gordonia phage Soos]|nr:membrane protein [Gordonia phage Soos]
MADKKTTALVENGVALIEVHDAADVPEIAGKLLAAADDPLEVDTFTSTGGVGFRVSEKLAKKAKLIQTATKTKTAAEKKAEAEAEAAKKAEDEKAAAEKAEAEQKSESEDGATPPQS